ncbi:unnamed protein product [Sphagnum jensenii]
MERIGRMEGEELTGFLREACSEINNGFPNEKDLHEAATCIARRRRRNGGMGEEEEEAMVLDGWMDGWGCARIEWRYGQTGRRFNDDRTDDSGEMR